MHSHVKTYMAGFLLLSQRAALRYDYRFSTFLLWLQSVQIPPHLFSAAKVTKKCYRQHLRLYYFVIAPSKKQKLKQKLGQALLIVTFYIGMSAMLVYGIMTATTLN